MTVRIEFLAYRFCHIGLSILIAALFLSLTLLAVHSAEIETPAQTATDSTVLTYLQSIACTQTVAGQHNREPNSDPALWTHWIYSVTGRYPKLWGGDFLYLSDDVNNRSTMIAEAKRQWNRGALVTLMWHVCPPTITQTSCNWVNEITGTLTADQWNELVTPSSNTTTLYHKWTKRLDEIVPYLEDLEANGVEVLWRPLHEMNSNWCWWCGRPGENGSQELYRITYRYLVNTKGLTNLIWVWNVKDITPTTTILSATEIYSSYYPGNAYVDVVSMDPLNYGFTQETYSATLIIAGDKPIAIGETGELPFPLTLTAQPCWTWFLGWAELVPESNTLTEIRAVYDDPRVVKLKLWPTWLPLIMSSESQSSISTYRFHLRQPAR